MTKSRWFERIDAGAILIAGVVSLVLATPAWAQASRGPNTGSLTLTGGVDVASAYVFRGLVQEEEPKLTLFPYGDLGVALTAGDGVVKGLAVNFGGWHSLNTGSSGSEGPSGHAHYEEQFYARVNLLLGKRIAIGGGYMARTSPNNMFDTQHEIQLKVAKTDWLIPYVFLASELSKEGQADFGRRTGTYLELGASPNFRVARTARLTIPAKAGFSVKDYYELSRTDHKFGFFNVGAMITVPFGEMASRFGSWNVHGGGEFYVFGDTPKAANDGKASKAVGFVGVGVLY